MIKITFIIIINIFLMNYYYMQLFFIFATYLIGKLKLIT
jgi:hypothetical protein